MIPHKDRQLPLLHKSSLSLLLGMMMQAMHMFKTKTALGFLTWALRRYVEAHVSCFELFHLRLCILTSTLLRNKPLTTTLAMAPTRMFLAHSQYVYILLSYHKTRYSKSLYP